mmetsp:Transcript_23218/g.39869  ORF Transcript_23218/g.39869 Transcript_23218/m.39869 type:complete len:288 (+) Transcript_23218:1028-1891(+)
MQESKIFGNLFLSIGAMKAGTTWLYAVMARHPELHFAMEKEIHYFYHRYVNKRQLDETRRLQEARSRYILRFDPEKSNIDVVRANLRWVSAYLDRPVDDYWYRNLFQLRQLQTYACDFSNLNAHLPQEAWPQIASKCDKLRVLYTMRDPVKRLWSHTKFHLQVSGQLEKLETWGPDDYRKFIRQKHIWDNAEYGAVLRKLKAGLAPEQYKVIFYEDLHADERGTLRGIETFLGVESFDYPEAVLKQRFTESAKHPMPQYFPELIENDVRRIKSEIKNEGFVAPEQWA